MRASRFQASGVSRKASGTAGTNTASSWRKAASLLNAKRRPFQLLTTARSNLSMGRSIFGSGANCC